MKLCDEELLTCPRGAKNVKLSDGDGLFAELPPNGNIRWRFRYIFAGRETQISLGLYPDVSIDNARKLRDEARDLLSRGINPSDERRASRFCFKVTKVKAKSLSLQEKEAYINKAYDIIFESLQTLRSMMGK